MRRAPDAPPQAEAPRGAVEAAPEDEVAAYYLSEAVRIELMASCAGDGRERFLRVAEEYRSLAAWRTLSDEDEDDLLELRG